MGKLNILHPVERFFQAQTVLQKNDIVGSQKGQIPYCVNLNQWCNLTIAGQFWATKVCLQASKSFKSICLVVDLASNFL